MLPKPEQPSKSNYYSNEKFDLEAFLNKHHIAVRNIVRTSSFTKYILDECPFNSSHRARIQQSLRCLMEDLVLSVCIQVVLNIHGKTFG